MKMTVLDIVPCSLVEYTGVSEAIIHRSDDKGSTHLWNVGVLQREHDAISQKAIIFMLYAWEPEIQHSLNVLTVASMKKTVFIWWRQFAPLKRRPTFTRPYGAVSQ
jgi:hypothetical protein